MISAILGVGGGLGLVLSGLLVDYLSWRWIFVVGAAAVGIATLLVHRYVPESPIKTPLEKRLVLVVSPFWRRRCVSGGFPPPRHPAWINGFRGCRLLCGLAVRRTISVQTGRKVRRSGARCGRK
jgi:MFS family permease